MRRNYVIYFVVNYIIDNALRRCLFHKTVTFYEKTV